MDITMEFSQIKALQLGGKHVKKQYVIIDFFLKCLHQEID
jgi:hypothetical protein